MKKQTIKTAFLYGRVSTSDQKDNGYSLPQQKRYLYEFCERNNIEVLEYFEEDHTSTTFERPKYKEMIRQTKKSKPDYILFHKWDRFSREPEGIPEVEKLLKQNIEPNSISEWINYGEPSYYFYLGIYILQAKVENKRRGERTKNGIIGALNEGRHVNKAPIGYINGKDPCNKNKPLIQPCPDKAPLIREIFEEYATGNCSQESLRKKYYNLGIKRSKSQFSNLLSNIIYIGKIKVPEYNGFPAKIVNALHKPIVDEATFIKVQKVKNSKANCRVNTKKDNLHEEKLPLRGGILVCSKCGSNLTGSPSTGGSGNKTFYYHCNPKKGCGERFSAEIAHAKFEDMIKDLKPTKGVISLFKAILEDEYKTHNKDADKMVNSLKTQKKSIEEMLDKLTERYISDDSIDKASYERLKTRYSGEIADITLQLAEAAIMFKDVEKFIEFGLQLLTSLDMFYKNVPTEIKRKIIRSIFSEKLVFEENEYRTPKFNEAVALIVNRHKGLQEVVNKKGDSFSRISYSVARTGLEPMTFGL